jgi:polyisoprenoid-binding protein YceI
VTIDRADHLHAPATRRLSLDRAGSVIEFSVGTFWGLSTISGRFDRFDGSYVVGPAGAKIELTVDAESIDTGATDRDEWLRTAASRAAGDHRQVRFTSTRVVDAGDGGLHVAGEVEAAGKMFQVAFPATIRELDGDVEIETKTTVDRLGPGMPSVPLSMLQPPATLHVRARFR